MPRKEKTTKHSYDAAPEGVDAEFKHVTAEERKKEASAPVYLARC